MAADESPRARRLADRIKVIIAEMVERRIKDPRLGFVTITDAHVTNDLREATVYYTVLGDAAEQQASTIALESSKGMLRTEIGREIRLRYAPTLEFVLDSTPENARHIEELIAKAKEADSRLRATTEQASYAGDADPYRTADIDEESTS